MGEAQSLLKCEECGGTELLRDYEAGELVCGQCGFVISSTVIDQGPEWRAFNQEQREKRARVGAPLTWTIPDKGLSTSIDHRNVDAYGRELKPNQKARLFRLRKWQQRSKTSGTNERNLTLALSELGKITDRLSLPKNVLETASVIYRRFLRKRIIRGRSIRSVVAASLYMACRECKVIRTLDEVAKAAHVPKKDVARNYRFLRRNTKSKIRSVDPVHFVSKFINQLKLSGETESIAVKILDQAIKIKLTSGRTPIGIAAAVIYAAGLITGERRTQGEIGRKSQLTEVTIRHRYRELSKKLFFKVEL